METKHTPGPLRACHRSDGSVGIISDGWGPIAELHRAARMKQEEMDANGDLLAAAPELLEALQNLLTAHLLADETGYVTDEGFLDIDAIVSAANSAIAKAEGNSHAS